MENVHLYLKAGDRPMSRHLVIESIVKERASQGACLLEVGCGAGQLLRLLSKARPDLKLYAADAYQNALDMASSSAGLSGTILLEEDVFDLTMGEGSALPDGYDIIVMCHVLEHMKNPISVIDACMDQLRPGGRLVLAVPNTARPTVLLTNMFQIHYVNKGHVYGWDVSHWRNFLERILSLDVESHHYDEVNLIPGKYGVWLTRLTGRFLAKIFPWWSFSNISVIQKS